MIKRKQIAFAVVAMLAAGSSWSQDCPCGSGTLVSDPAALANLLGGRTVCAAVGNEAWQEFHTGATQSGGALVDYKRGPGDPVDPSKTVGNWSITTQASAARSRNLGATIGVVRYEYGNPGSGQVYTYSVCQAGLLVNFCGQRNITGATLQNGQVACPAARR